MGLGDQIKNATDGAIGKAKETIGDLTNNEQLEAEGRLQQGKAEVKGKVEEAKEGIAEKFNDATDGRNDT